MHVVSSPLSAMIQQDDDPNLAGRAMNRHQLVLIKHPSTNGALVMLKMFMSITISQQILI